MGHVGHMGDGVPTPASIQTTYWAFVGAAIAFATLVNVLNKVSCWERLVAASRGVAEPAKPRRFIPSALATATAMMREIAYAMPPSTNIGKLRIRSPELGRTLVVCAELVLVLVLCFYKLDVQDKWSWQDLGYRTGFVTAAQLPLIYILSGKNNIIGLLTGLGYERLNWLHRWTARILLLSATIHMIFWFESWARYNYIKTKLLKDQITQRGFASWCILVWIVLSSFAPLRKLNYEFFVVQHVVTLAGFTAATYLHLPNDLKMLVWISVAFAIFDRTVRTSVVMYNNLSIFHPRTKCEGLWASRATFEPLARGYTRLTVRNPPIRWRPGQHVFLSCQSIVPLQSHPFTISSLPHDGVMQFIVKAHSGGSRSFFRHAEKSQRLPISGRDTRVEGSSVAVEGPYGRMRPLLQFDSVIFLAGGVGSTFTIPLMRDLVRSWTTSRTGISESSAFFDTPATYVTKHIRFVWIIKSRDQLAWFASQLTNAAEEVASLRAEGYDLELRISIYLTCDEELTASENRVAQPLERGLVEKRAANDLEDVSKDVTSIKVERVSSAVSNAPVIVRPTCGPNGTCCCTATVEDEDVDTIAECRCDCGPAGDNTTDAATGSVSMASDASSISSANPKTPMGGSTIHPSIALLSGRPHPRTLIRRTLEQARGESAVVVCGPAGLLDDVKVSVVRLSDERAVHKGTGAQGIYLHAEEFCF